MMLLSCLVNSGLPPSRKNKMSLLPVALSCIFCHDFSHIVFDLQIPTKAQTCIPKVLISSFFLRPLGNISLKSWFFFFFYFFCSYLSCFPFHKYWLSSYRITNPVLDATEIQWLLNGRRLCRGDNAPTSKKGRTYLCGKGEAFQERVPGGRIPGAGDSRTCSQSHMWSSVSWKPKG